VRTFLLQTSILERLCGPLCDAVTGRADGQGMLEEQERAHLFLVPMDEERRWWRLHHLFADLLRARVLKLQPDLVHELHRRVAGWCKQHGLIDAAIRHALAVVPAPSARCSRHEASLARPCAPTEKVCAWRRSAAGSRRTTQVRRAW
jgi:ATP/maltotriose-dependent transcriptional regulator MalT